MATRPAIKRGWPFSKGTLATGVAKLGPEASAPIIPQWASKAYLAFTMTPRGSEARARRFGEPLCAVLEPCALHKAPRVPLKAKPDQGGQFLAGLQ